jgi:RNA polymerase sigma-70 factor (ECF subfamily)
LIPIKILPQRPAYKSATEPGDDRMAHAVTEFEQLYDTYRPKILRYLIRLVGAGEAEDLTQLVFIKVGQGLPNFRGDASIATWIYRIATNVAVDRLRSQSSQPLLSIVPAARALSPDDAENECGTPADVDATPVETEAVRLEMNECIGQFIDRLPENHRTVIVLSDIEGFTNKEIADIVGASVDTVKIRLHRARAELRNKLEGGCEFYRDEQNEFACDRKPAAHVTPT